MVPRQLPYCKLGFAAVAAAHGNTGSLKSGNQVLRLIYVVISELYQQIVCNTCKEAMSEII